MKIWIAALAVMLMVGFTSVAMAAKPAKGEKPVVGQLKSVAADSKSIVVATMGKTASEQTIVVDDKTTVTVDGKDGKLADLKADMYVVVSPAIGTATSIVASTEKPKGKGKGKKPA